MELEQRIKLAKKSLIGVSIGDAFGESFFGEREKILHHIQNRTIPTTTWEYTDDTVMSIAVFEQLVINQNINQDELALKFAANHFTDPNRGYGATARRILRGIHEGENWKELAYAVFDGMGSMGNGAAMRANSIGAFFFDEIEKIKLLSKKSAEITHANIEAAIGAMAVAIATSIATQINIEKKNISPHDFITKVYKPLPDSDTKSKIKKSLSVPKEYNIETVKSILGNGEKMLSQDTVPFCIWCAAHHLNSFEGALWKAVSILGDRDTICAIVGGIVIMSSDEEYIPNEWIHSVEKIRSDLY